MKRRIATWAAAALTILSLAACSGSPEAAPVPSDQPSSSALAEPAAPTSATTTLPAATTAPDPEPSEASVAEACIEPNSKMLEAQADLMEASAALVESDGKDAEAAVEAFKEMGDYFSTLAESAVNSEVGAALAGMGKAYAELAIPYGKLLVDNDLGAAADATRALADLQESLEAFQTLCGVS